MLPNYMYLQILNWGILGIVYSQGQYYSVVQCLSGSLLRAYLDHHYSGVCVCVCLVLNSVKCLSFHIYRANWVRVLGTKYRTLSVSLWWDVTHLMSWSLAKCCHICWWAGRSLRVHSNGDKNICSTFSLFCLVIAFKFPFLSNKAQRSPWLSPLWLVFCF